MSSHEPEDFWGTVPVSRANQAAAFASISRSVFSWRLSRRSRRSSSRSSLVSPLALSPSSRSACLIHVRIPPVRRLELLDQLLHAAPCSRLLDDLPAKLRRIR